ncbi:MAG TPA: DUF1932 domain-containing protein [Planctomycetaceae bacterium]|nr:DUF1932 domain-containing protein [Planctomycetaceae bacterium]
MSRTVSLASPLSPRAALRSDSLAAGVLVILATTILQRSIGFARAVLICRWLDADQLGQWDVTFSFLEMAAPLAVLGLPGSFSRYMEYYRARGQSRTFLRRMSIATLALAAATLAAFCWNREWFSVLLYGESQATLIHALLFAAPAFVLFCAVSELFAALRMVRVVSAMQFTHSLLFASLSVGFVALWRPDASSVVIAFGAACVLSLLGTTPYVGQVWSAFPRAAEVTVPTQRDFWGRLIPFVASVWVCNTVAQLFTSVDRYMLVHYSGMSAPEALAAVGQYHSARVIPSLIVTVAGLFATLLIPFLSCDWEGGRRERVSDRVNSFVKLVGLVLTTASTGVLVAAPLLFGWGFGGKFDGGLAILSWVLTCAVWYGMFNLAKSYLWCDERVTLVAIALGGGVLVNVLCNLVLLRPFGLHGAVISTCIATLAALLCVYGLTSLRGMRIQRGVWLVTLLPLALNFGTLGALIANLAILVLAGTTEWIFTHAEQAELRNTLSQALAKWKTRRASSEDAGLNSQRPVASTPSTADVAPACKAESNRPTIGIVFPGDMGTSLGSLLAGAGFNVVTALDGRSSATSRRSAAAGIRDLGSLAALAAEADVVLSLVPPTASLAMAEAFCSELKPTSRTRVFADLNSISPMTAGEIEQVCRKHGVTMVDGAIHGQANRLAEMGLLYLSGREAERVAALFTGLLNTRVVGAEVGRASMLKMLMSGVSKGITALFLEMGRAASEAQMLDEFWESVVRFYPGFTSAVERMLPTVPRHARRRAGEMGELADTLANLSLPPGLMLEFQRLYADVGRAVSPETVAASGELCIRELLDQLASEMRLASREHDEQLNQLVLPTTHGN